MCRLPVVIPLDRARPNVGIRESRGGEKCGRSPISVPSESLLQERHTSDFRRPNSACESARMADTILLRSTGHHRRMATDKTLLVFNCHEPWIHQLGILGYRLDIIVNLRGKYNKGWDERMRPLPAHSRLVTLPEALASPDELLLHRRAQHDRPARRPVPPGAADARAAPHARRPIAGGAFHHRSPEDEGHAPHVYRCWSGATSSRRPCSKANPGGSRTISCSSAIDVDDYPLCSGQEARGLRICNFINSRRQILLWDLHERAFADLPVTLVGHNPDLPGVEAARNWDHLKASSSPIASTSTRRTRASRRVTTWRWRKRWPPVCRSWGIVTLPLRSAMASPGSSATIPGSCATMRKCSWQTRNSRS